MVPTELLVTAMIGGFAIAMTSVVATVRVLGSRIGDIRDDVRDLRVDVGARFDLLESRIDSVDSRFDRRFTALEQRFGAMADDLTTTRASPGTIDARLTTLEQPWMIDSKGGQRS